MHTHAQEEAHLLLDVPVGRGIDSAQHLQASHSESETHDRDEEKSPEVNEGLLQAMVRLQDWLTALYDRKLIHYGDDGIVQISPVVANRFALGFWHEAPFVALPEAEALWATSMPWSYAAMVRGKRNLYLVTQPLHWAAEDAKTPAFAMSFLLQSQMTAHRLSCSSEIDIRLFEPPSHRGKPSTRVREDVLVTIPLHVLEPEDPVFDTRMGKKTKKSAGVGR